MNEIVTADLHCDLLSYLQEAPDADPLIGGRIGCTIPDLQAGHVKFQVMAIYTATGKGSVESALGQAQLFAGLISEYKDYFSDFNLRKNSTGFSEHADMSILTAIENAAGLCEEDEPVKNTFSNLERLISLCGKPMYVGLTHHTENRFGGGNATSIGLKEDGKALITYLSELNIALDFSHTSDVLAYDIINFIEKNNLQIPIIASHSNFRSVYNHARNLPDDVAKEIIERKGLIGINLLRAFLNPEDANALYDHIQYGLTLGAQEQLCFGADYFYCDSHPDQSRKPFFFPEHSTASSYPKIVESLAEKINEAFAARFSYKNIQRFIAQTAG